MGATMHKWIDKKGDGGGGASGKELPAGTIPARPGVTVGTMPALLPTVALPSAHNGQGSGADMGSLVPVTTIINGDESTHGPQPPSVRVDPEHCEKYTELEGVVGHECFTA